MATYNGERYLKNQIESILPQLSENDELIISDDNSSDSTIRIISGFNDNRIRLLNHTPTGIGSFEKAKYNFENALMHAKGDYIFLSDQDDIWDLDKINRMIPFLKKYGCVQHGKYELFSNNGTREQCPSLKNNHNLLSGILSMHFAGCCMGMSRDFLKKALPIPKRVATHDGWFACYAISLNTYHYVPDCLLYHRVHGKNVSVGTKNSIIYKLKYRVILLYEILRRKYLL